LKFHNSQFTQFSPIFNNYFTNNCKEQFSNSVVLNREYIKRYNHQAIKITLTDDTEMPVSRRRAKELKETLSERKGLSSIVSSFISKYEKK